MMARINIVPFHIPFLNKAQQPGLTANETNSVLTLCSWEFSARGGGSCQATLKTTNMQFVANLKLLTDEASLQRM